MPAEDDGGYDIIQNGGAEHLIPENDGIHEALSTCACGPMRARDVRGPGRMSTYLHRSLPAPL